MGTPGIGTRRARRRVRLWSDAVLLEGDAEEADESVNAAPSLPERAQVRRRRVYVTKAGARRHVPAEPNPGAPKQGHAIA
jgi:hypothetical protein